MALHFMLVLPHARSKRFTPLTDHWHIIDSHYSSTVYDIDLPGRADIFPDLCDLYDLYDLYDLALCCPVGAV